MSFGIFFIASNDRATRRSIKYLKDVWMATLVGKNLSYLKVTGYYSIFLSILFSLSCIAQYTPYAIRSKMKCFCIANRIENFHFICNDLIIHRVYTEYKTNIIVACTNQNFA